MSEAVFQPQEPLPDPQPNPLFPADTQPLTEANYLVLLGLLPLNSPVSAVISTVWSLFAPKDGIWPTLRYYYAMQELIRLQEGRVARRAVDWEQAGVSQDDSGYFENLQTLYSQAWEMIETLEEKAKGGRGAYVTQMLHTAPGGPLVTGNDPNHPALGGDPRYHWWRRR